MRPHLEFVPLFFLGYHVMRTPERLRVFLVLLAIIGAANGAVSLVQFSLSPSQVAAWGPGYSDRINGEGVAPRTFQDGSGEDRVRPFGLGSDSGQGGIFGMLALPAALTLLAITRGKRYRLLAAPAAIGVALAVITSQGRGAVIATAVTLLGFAALSIVSSKRIGPTLVGIGLAVIVVFGVTSALSGGSSGGSGSQFRYSSITPGKVLGTTQEDRGHSYDVIGKYMVQYPLGAGLGSVGPASQIYASRRHFNGETEFTYLLVEGGLAALIVILCLHIQLLRLAFTRIRKLVDRELRAFLAALAAPLIGILALYFGGAPLSGVPSGPYFWFAAGTLAFWLTGERWKRVPIAQASAQSRT
jgi:O-antigen ligase